MKQFFIRREIKNLSVLGIILIVSAICALEVFAALPHGTSDKWIASDMVNNNPPADYKINKKTQGKAKEGEYNKYFLKDDLQEVYIEIEENNLNYLLQNAKQEQYVMATGVTIGDTEVKYPGLKTKGDYTLMYSYDGNYGSDRFSFTVNFGKYINKKDYGEKQNFYGCEKISFNNFYFDKSMMKEFVSYKLLEEMGVPVPQYGLAKLYINNQYYGVYFMVEDLDESIVEQYYGVDDIDGYVDKPKDTTLKYEQLLVQPQLLCGNDASKLSDIEDVLPTVLEWSRKLCNLSEGMDFEGNTIDVNSEEYIDLLNQVMNVDEALRYFATHSWLCQTDSMFVWLKNYGLYVSEEGVATIIPWDYDLSFGCYGDGLTNNAENTINYNVDMMYWPNYGSALGKTIEEVYSRFPLFNVIYQNEELKNKYRFYMNECSKIAALGGIVESTGKEYSVGYLNSYIDNLEEKLIVAAGEDLASNVYYMNGIQQPANVKDALPHLKKIIVMRAVGVKLQLQGSDARVTATQCNNWMLGNGVAGESSSSGMLACVDSNTGIYTIAKYGNSKRLPLLSVENISQENGAFMEFEKYLGKKVLNVYKMSNTKKPEGEYTLTIPMSTTQSKDNLEFYTYVDGSLKKLDVTVEDNLYTMVTENIEYIVISEAGISLADNNDGIEGYTIIVIIGILCVVSSVALIIVLVKKKWLIAVVVGIVLLVCSGLVTVMLSKRTTEKVPEEVAYIKHENIVKAQENIQYEEEVLTGKSWWGNYENSKSYTFVDNGKMILDIEIDKNNDPNNSGFCVEVYDNAGYYFTTTTNGDAWYAETDGSMSGLQDPIVLTPGKIIRVIVTREGRNYTFEYYDKETGKNLLRITAVEDGAFSNIINLRIMAQVGTYKVRMVEFIQ